ncbi:MAG: pyridoxal phosphate-dependent aminotransferase [Phycisphaerae bacterium]
MDLTKFVASRIGEIGSSGIRRVFELGASLKDPINLSIGQPDFAVPDEVKAAMTTAIRDDKNGYTLTRGIPALRDRIATQLHDEFQWTPDLFVTSGLSGGLFLALLTCINPGDEVLMADPYFVSYTHLVRLTHGQPVLVDHYDGFHLRADLFEQAITPRTKIILVCSPGNPTGVVYSSEDMRALCDVARTHDLLIVSDEIYATLSYDGPNPSPVTFAPERTVLLRGFGKSHAMTGLRMGYAAGPPAIIEQMAKLQQYTFVCAPHPAQLGALAAMETDMSEQIARYKAKRDLVCNELYESFSFTRPSGGFYVFPKVPAAYPNATAFSDEAVKRNLLVIPGEVFSQRDTHFRISYAASDETIRRGCAVLRELARDRR